MQSSFLQTSSQSLSQRQSQSQSQSQRQGQQLKLNPKLIQAFKLLQSPLNDLATHIQRELAENPFLQEETNNELTLPSSATSSLANLEASSFSSSHHHANATSVSDIIEATVSGHKYLSEELGEQLDLLYQKDSLEWKISMEIISALDDDGYFSDDLTHKIALHLNVAEATVLDILKEIQDFHPPGIAARNLKECLLLQLKRLKKDPISNTESLKEESLEEKIIAENFDWLGKNKMTTEKKILQRYKKLYPNLSETVIRQALDSISMLEPKPARPYGNEQVQYISPDLYVFPQKDKSTDLVLQVNDYFLPKISLNKEYDKYLHLADKDKLKNYLQEKKLSAQNLLDNLSYRKSSLQMVGEKLLELQKDFFLKGSTFLQSYQMKQFAEDIDIHPSTLSRIVNQKYIQTPFGLFSLRIFFSYISQTKTKISETPYDNHKHSAHQIKLAITKILKEHREKQSPHNAMRSTVISDQKLTDLLSQAGYKIARRTVTKYRNQLNILSSFYR